jgi:hypothetical protein
VVSANLMRCRVEFETASCMDDTRFNSQLDLIILYHDPLQKRIANYVDWWYYKKKNAKG